MKKVLFILADNSGTGASRVGFELYNGLKSLGHFQCEITIIKEASSPLFLASAIMPRTARHWPLAGELAKAAGKIVDKIRPDFVFVNSIAALEVCHVLQKKGIPYALFLHEYSRVFLKFMLGRVFCHILFLAPNFIVSPVKKLPLYIHVLGLQKARVVYLPTKARASKDKSYGNSEHGPVVGCGSDFYRKGVDRFVRVINQIGIEAEWLGEVGRVGMYQGVKFRGWVSRVDGIVGRACCFVHLAREDPNPIVVCDALSVGTFVVCLGESGEGYRNVFENGIIISRYSEKSVVNATKFALTYRSHVGASQKIRNKKRVRRDPQYEAKRVQQEIKKCFE